ncbi:MAG: AMP-binding protein [Gemmatimonadetes bacterium]|nr:AMP-binding protein [Gemmatimonadota bacterium]
MLADLVERRARDNRDDPFCFFADEVITFGALDAAANRLANNLTQAGIGPADRVAVMLPSHPDHVCTMLALAKLGVTHVPVNVHHKADGIQHLLEHAGVRVLMADRQYQSQLANVKSVIWREELLAHSSGQRVHHAADPEHLAMILYTSGTTGPQKGVMVTDQMYQTAARNAGIAADVRAGDVLFLWEPLHHVAGVQTVILCLQQGIACAMVERFSASRFWEQVRRYRATQIHYLGGVLGLLMKQPERPDDADNPVRIAYGAPAPPDLWPRFEKRFGVKIHECYGMTEGSSFTTINLWGKVGSIGKPVKEFEVRIVDDEDRPVPAGEIGEIVQRGLEPGVVMQGYLNDPEETRIALRNDWLHTGDLGLCDAEGFFYFAGRKKDTIRCRGENVSAWVVERAAAAFPNVEECAAIGVPSELGEEDIKLFVRTAAGRGVDPAALIRFCEERLAYFQVPRYVEFIDEFPKTPSERIRKAELSRSTEGAIDVLQHRVRDRS